MLGYLFRELLSSGCASTTGRLCCALSRLRSNLLCSCRPRILLTVLRWLVVSRSWSGRPLVALWWPLVFYLFGAIGVGWVVLFWRLGIGRRELSYNQFSPDSGTGPTSVSKAATDHSRPPTVCEVLRQPAFRAVMCTHICVNWGYCELLLLPLP